MVIIVLSAPRASARKARKESREKKKKKKKNCSLFRRAFLIFGGAGEDNNNHDNGFCKLLKIKRFSQSQITIIMRAQIKAVKAHVCANLFVAVFSHLQTPLFSVYYETSTDKYRSKIAFWLEF